jgi:hypothetical protein
MRPANEKYGAMLLSPVTAADGPVGASCVVVQAENETTTASVVHTKKQRHIIRRCSPKLFCNDAVTA